VAADAGGGMDAKHASTQAMMQNISPAELIIATPISLFGWCWCSGLRELRIFRGNMPLGLVQA